MRGLRTQETNKFRAYMELVQNKASEKDCVFFMESGDGNDFETDSMEGENLQGWLIPFDKADVFEEVWKNKKEDDEYVDFFCWVEWFERKGEIDIKFITE